MLEIELYNMHKKEHLTVSTLIKWLVNFIATVCLFERIAYTTDTHLSLTIEL